MQIQVWDIPMRVFHWLLMAAFFTAYFTGDPDRLRDIHVFAGFVILGLLIFRLLWGKFGSRYARFNSFRYSFREAADYIGMLFRQHPPRYLGHNPAGSWMIYLILTSGLLTCLTGILVWGGEEEHGMLRTLFRFASGDVFKDVHDGLAIFMLVLVIIHLAGVFAESWMHHENLTWAMVTGRKRGELKDGIAATYPLIGVVMIALIVAGGAWFFQGKFTATKAKPYIPFVGKALPDNKLWREECGSCHLAYHPTLLPARSWAVLMQQQQQHFGKDLGLDSTVVAEIDKFLQENSADTEMTEPARKIRLSIPTDAAPLRVTETGYWRNKHSKISDAIWRDPSVRNKGNCGACHLDAERGTFEDAAMHLPKGINLPPVKQ